MENSSTPFTDLLNTNLPPNSQNKQDTPHQQIPGYPPPQFHMNFPPQHFGYQPHYPQGYMPFGGQGSYQHAMAGPQQSYQQFMASGSHLGAPYQGGQYPQGVLGGGMFGGPSSPASSSVFLGAAGGSSSRCDDSSSPMSSAPYSPIYPAGRCLKTSWQLGVDALMWSPSCPAVDVERSRAACVVDVGVPPVNAARILAGAGAGSPSSTALRQSRPQQGRRPARRRRPARQRRAHPRRGRRGITVVTAPFNVARNGAASVVASRAGIAFEASPEGIKVSHRRIN